MAKILIIDDDVAHNRMVSAFLSKENHVVETATTGGDAVHLMSINSYDVIILDWILPDIEGTEICRQYRKTGGAPILMLTGKGAIAHREEGLDAGADDYLIKPFSMKELAARIRALLRRPPILTGTQLSFGEYALDRSSLTVSNSAVEVKLPPREFALLEFLARHPNDTFSAEAIIERVWKSGSEATTDSVRTTVREIRKRLKDEAVIVTIAGAGYKIGYRK